jgi:hypothetical protein
MEKMRSNSNITEKQFQSRLEQLSGQERRWAQKMLFLIGTFNNYLNEFIQIQANIIYLSDKLDYSKLKQMALNQEERDFSNDPITDDMEMNYMIALDTMIHHADQLLENCVLAYQKLLPHERIGATSLNPGAAKAVKLFVVHPEERDMDLIEQMANKWAELIGQLSVYVLLLRQKRAVLEALRDNPENPENENPDEGLTPTQLFLGAY